MAIIIFKGWKVGMRGIPFVLLLREKTDVSLKRAKEIKERIVDNETIEFPVSNDEIAGEIVVEARKLGVVCEIKGLENTPSN
jgi:hypothetical protein